MLTAPGPLDWRLASEKGDTVFNPGSGRQAVSQKLCKEETPQVAWEPVPGLPLPERDWEIHLETGKSGAGAIK